MDVEELQTRKREMEKHLLSLVAAFESETGVVVATVQIRRIDSSTLEGKSSLIGSLEVVLAL